MCTVTKKDIHENQNTKINNINKTKMSKEEPYMTFMTNEEIVKHIEHLKTLDLPELEKQGMISDWKKSLNQNKDERNTK